MELGNSLSMGLSQKLVLTHKMKLSLKILQMNSGELNEFLEKEQEKNILLRVEKRDTARGRSHRDDEYDPYSMATQRETSFYDYLYNQIWELGLDKNMKEICEYIVDNIDSRGYLSHWVRHPYNQFDFDRGLEIVRGFDPIGVAGNDLKACLLLQLKDDEVYEKILVEDYLEELAYGDKSRIAKDMGIDMGLLTRLITRIKGLNPIPSKGYYVEDRGMNLVPDAYVKVAEGKIKVELNEEVIPKILVEQSELTVYDIKYEKYIEKCRKRAEFIIGCINQRQTTFRRVLEEVAKRQGDYLKKGKLRPLTLMEVSDSLEIHQSTVSRAVKNRYIDIEGSVIEVKKLFAKQYKPKNHMGPEYEMTRESIKNYLYEIIMKEDKKKPYSDDKIVRLMKADEIDISRRTVAKYREEMKLPSSTGRRKR